MVDAALVLDALGDPTRRAILEQLADGPAAVGVLAGRLPISRPAVSQHLRVLREAELVSESVAGTRHIYRVNHAGLAAVRDYVGRFWSTTLDNFAALAEQEAALAAPRDPPSTAPPSTAPPSTAPPSTAPPSTETRPRSLR